MHVFPPALGPSSTSLLLQGGTVKWSGTVTWCVCSNSFPQHQSSGQLFSITGARQHKISGQQVLYKKHLPFRISSVKLLRGRLIKENHSFYMHEVFKRAGFVTKCINTVLFPTQTRNGPTPEGVQRYCRVSWHNRCHRWVTHTNTGTIRWGVGICEQEGGAQYKCSSNCLFRKCLVSYTFNYLQTHLMA